MWLAKKFSFLRKRLYRKKGIAIASSFYSLREAQSLINKTLNWHVDKVAEMMAINGTAYAVINSTFNKPTGYLIEKGRRGHIGVYNLRVVLIKPATTKEGFLVLTAYPHNEPLE